MKNKLISYSLYGKNIFYIKGAINSVIRAKKYYPDWKCRFYISQEIEDDIIKELFGLGAEIVKRQKINNFEGLFWRFEPISEDGLSAVIVRDTDSVITEREVLAVEQWLTSSKKFHIIRDHPYHRVPIMGGIFGVKKGSVNNIKKLIDEWKFKDKHGSDQEFLKRKIYPIIKNDCLIHSELVKFSGEEVMPFPVKRNRGEFVGCHKYAEELTSTEFQIISKLFEKAKLKEYKYPIPIYKNLCNKIIFEILNFKRNRMLNRC